jgi:hypothetical protein
LVQAAGAVHAAVPTTINAYIFLKLVVLTSF